jgi:protein-S-isoprenylcysteine O-methyltransferase Ste14
MLPANPLGKYRVKFAQVIFWLLFIYCFIIEPITIAPLTECRGLVGSGVALFGVFIRSLSAGYISKNAYLASRGLYALTRNPLYFGSFVILVGLNIVIWNLLFAAVTFALFAITYIPTILGEEKSLSVQFAEQWAEFVKGTPRFFPAFWRLSAYREIGWDFNQWKRNHEYNAVLTVLAILAALAVYSMR